MLCFRMPPRRGRPTKGQPRAEPKQDEPQELGAGVASLSPDVASLRGLDQLIDKLWSHL